MCRSFLTGLFLWLSTMTLPAQTTSQAVTAPSRNDFTGILAFLSSNWMEGREAVARGGFMAADYISSIMQLNGLLPYGDTGTLIKPGSPLTRNRTYFQNFEVVRYHVEKSSLAIIRHSLQGESALQLNPGIDFNVDPAPFGSEAEAPVVFAGYGLEAPGKGYNDYTIEVKDRVVMILPGYPGHSDTTSPAWKKLGKSFGTEFAELSKKLRIAEKNGAVAVIYINPNDNIKPYRNSICNQDIVNNAMNSTELTGPEYDDPEYYLPGDTSLGKIPCFRLGADAMRLLTDGTGIDLSGFEKKAARNLVSASIMVPGKRIRLSVEVKQEPLTVRNVLGILPGLDTTRNIIVGAHYDHLGIRKGVIWNGADDNASGVSGMLALARAWAGHSEKPSCNIIFAAWTAEEKGLLGSDFFARHSTLVPGRISLVINLDMISGSAADDTARRVISIGTLPINEDLKKIARKCNSQLEHPFTLDLWDVTGHSGSDYGPFASRKISVMTFFSGFTDDYHTPRDVAARADPEKMEKILKVVNDCILETSKNPPSR